MKKEKNMCDLTFFWPVVIISDPMKTAKEPQNNMTKRSDSKERKRTELRRKKTLMNKFTSFVEDENFCLSH